jgi:hypothetical protein
MLNKNEEELRKSAKLAGKEKRRNCTRSAPMDNMYTELLEHETVHTPFKPAYIMS